MTAAFYRTDDLRIKWTKVVLPPVFLEEEPPATEQVSSAIYHARNQISDILAGKDHRLLVVAGPCSIRDTKAAREYTGPLKGAIGELSKELCIVMRVYFEEPRTTVGWKGLPNDPYLDQSYEINDGPATRPASSVFGYFRVALSPLATFAVNHYIISDRFILSLGEAHLRSCVPQKDFESPLGKRPSVGGSEWKQT